MTFLEGVLAGGGFLSERGFCLTFFWPEGVFVRSGFFPEGGFVLDPFISRVANPLLPSLQNDIKDPMI